MGAVAGFGTRFLYTLEPAMGALLPLVGKAPAIANPAEKAVLGSSLETFLITSILDTICLPLGGFSETENNKKSLNLDLPLVFQKVKTNLDWEHLPHTPAWGATARI